MALTLPAALQSLLDQPVHRFATLWDIERTDGVTKRFTDHSSKLTFEGNAYAPAGGFDASARQKMSGLKSRNFEARGIIDSDEITFDDLRAGKYYDAKITERVVDWKFPWAQAFVTSVYWIHELSFDGQVWQAQLAGRSRWLREFVGQTYNRVCRHDLGDRFGLPEHHDGCSVDIVNGTARMANNVVVPITQLDKIALVTLIPNRRSQFTSTLSGGFEDGWFKYGVVTWGVTANGNDGTQQEISGYADAGGTVALRTNTPNDIVAGDRFDIFAGCNKLKETCIEKFDNLKDHGGFPYIPGNDRLVLPVVGTSEALDTFITQLFKV